MSAVNPLLTFELDDTTYHFDQSRLSIAEARLVKRHTGMGFALWDAQINIIDPDAIAAMVLLAKRRASEEVEWADLDEINLAALVKTLARAEPETPDDLASVEEQTDSADTA